MINHSHLPAVPLITHDPFFSIWDASVLPTAGVTTHWTGAEKPIQGYVTVDGEKRLFFGRSGKKPMNFLRSEITPLSSKYIYEDLGVRFSVTFTSPLLLDDFDVLSTPVSYLDLEAVSADGAQHEVAVQIDFHPKFVFSGETTPEIRKDFFTDDGLSFGYMGQMIQKPLSGSGDHTTIDWGYLFLAAKNGEIADHDAKYSRLSVKVCGRTGFCETVLVGYEDVASIQYFDEILRSYYARNGKTIVEAIKEFSDRHDELMARCKKADEEILKAAREIGGEAYARILTASYRQSIAAHKLVCDRNGDPVFISKENDSNGCAATVDVSYPSVPLYLLYAPELVRAMCRPILKFAKMRVWKYDFAPHDAGRYPILNGQVYASRKRANSHEQGHTAAPLYLYPGSEENYDFRSQMPVEESADMILMLAAAGYADGDYTLAKENLPLLRTWCEYLLKYGEDPGEQLCTDDFAGHLARNVNLSAKSFVGIAAFAMILKETGAEEEASRYFAKAETMAESWLERSGAESGHSALTFDGGGWSQKYNLVWDRLFRFGLLPESFYEKEIAFYLTKMNEYGLPLDSRADYTKSDWTMWTASLAGDRETFAAFAEPLAKFLDETPTRVPFSDWYDTVTGCYESFIARSVQGGNFMPVLMKRWSERK